MKINFKILIFFIAMIAFLTRFISLSSVPPHLSNDEISIGYDAYSVSKTFKDEHNHFLPLSFQSHSTYKAPLTIYLTIPFVIIFGNNDFAVRAPSALLGTLSVLILGLLVYELSKNKYLSLLSSFLLAITPYHILTSRMAYEPNIALFFFCLGIYMFLIGARKDKAVFLLGSFIPFALSLYGYHVYWVLTPLIIGLLIYFYKNTINKKGNIYLGIFLFLILISPLFIDFLNNLHNTTRANTEFIIKEQSLALKLENPNYPFFQKGSFIIQAILEKYSSYLNFSYLFFTGSNLQPEGDPFQVGLFLLPLLPFFFFGLIKLKAVFKEHAKFIYSLLILSPLVPSLTQGPQSHSRYLVSVIPVSIICASGIYLFWKSSRIIWKLIFISIFLISFFYFLIIFYYHFPKDWGEGYQYGYKQIALFIRPRYNNFKQIIIDPRFGPESMYAGVPHLYISYFTNLDPSKLQESKQDKFTTFFDKYQIREINWNSEELADKTLYIVPASNPPKNDLRLRKEYEIILPNFKPAFYLYTLDKF